jgi:hypothetical protein
MSKQNNKTQKHKKNGNRKISFGSAVPNKLYSQVFPREMKITMKYSDLRSFTTSGATANDKLFNLNSINDPDFTGVGHRPAGYNEWAAFYNRYRVDHCKVRFCVSYTSADSLICAVLGNNSTTALTVPNDVLESPLVRSKHYSKNAAAISITKNYDLANLNGVSRMVYNDDDRYSSPFGSDPTEKLMLHTMLFDPAGNNVVVNCSVELEFMVTLFDPRQLPVS